MRIYAVTAITLGLPTLLAGGAEARKRPAAAPVVTESAGARAARLASPDATGELRAQGPSRLELANGAVETSGQASEHSAVNGEEAPVRPVGPLSGALEEMVAKQMRSNEAAFVQCAADASNRGTVRGKQIVLIIQATGRHAEARLADPSQVDAFTTSCLRSAARGLRVSLADFAYQWKLPVPAPEKREVALAK